MREEGNEKNHAKLIYSFLFLDNCEISHKWDGIDLLEG